MLSVNNINVFYEDLQVIWDVTFKIKTGEVVAIVGSNSAGKTTLLKTLSGLLHPKSGVINFLDKRIDTFPAHLIVELGVVLISGGRELFSRMSVLENLEMGAYHRKAREKKNESLEIVFQLFPILKERKNQLATTLSGGEQQMLAIGRGLMSRPKLIMLDEPSVGLAPKLVLQTFEIVETINQEGTTVLLVEQNVDSALKSADRGYVLENGRVMLEGSGEELRDNEQVKKAYLGI